MDEFPDASFGQNANSDSAGETFAYHEEDSVDIYAGLEGTPVKDGHSGKAYRSSSSPMRSESMDLFEEIIVEERLKKDASYSEMKSKFDEAQSQLQELVQKLQQMETQNVTLQTENTLLKKNLCSLIKTAKSEIGRKDAEINRLSERADRGAFDQTFRRPQWNQHTSHAISRATTCKIGNYSASPSELPRTRSTNVVGDHNIGSSVSAPLDSVHGFVPELHHVSSHGSLNPTTTASCSGDRGQNVTELKRDSVMAQPATDSAQSLSEQRSSSQINMRYHNPPDSEKSGASTLKDRPQKHKSPPQCLTLPSEISKAPSKDYSEKDLSEKSRVGLETEGSTLSQESHHNPSSDKPRVSSRSRRDKSPPVCLVTSYEKFKGPDKDFSENLLEKNRIGRESENSTCGQGSHHNASSERPNVSSSHKRDKSPPLSLALSEMSKRPTKDLSADLSERSRVEAEGSHHNASLDKPRVSSIHRRDKSPPLCPEASYGNFKEPNKDFTCSRQDFSRVTKEMESSNRSQGFRHNTSSDKPRVSSSHRRDKSPPLCLASSEMSKGPTKDFSTDLLEESRIGRETGESTCDEGSHDNNHSDRPRVSSRHRREKSPPLCPEASSENVKDPDKDLSENLSRKSRVAKEMESSNRGQGSRHNTSSERSRVSSNHKRGRCPPLCLASSGISKGLHKDFPTDLSERSRVGRETEESTRDQGSHHKANSDKPRIPSSRRRGKSPPLCLESSENLKGPDKDFSADLSERSRADKEIGGSTCGPGSHHNTRSDQLRVSYRHRRDKSPAWNYHREQRKKERSKELTNRESKSSRSDKNRDHELRKSERRKERLSSRESSSKSMQQKEMDKAPERKVDDGERREGLFAIQSANRREEESSHKKDQTELPENTTSRKTKPVTISEGHASTPVPRPMNKGDIYHSVGETVIECREAKTTVDTKYGQMKVKSSGDDQKNNGAVQQKSAISSQELAEVVRPAEEDSPNRKLSFMETLNLTLSPVKKPNQNQSSESAEAGSIEKSNLNDTGEEFFVIDELEASIAESHVGDAADSPESSSKLQVDLNGSTKTAVVENEIKVSADTDLVSRSQADVVKANDEKGKLGGILLSSEVYEKVTTTSAKNITPDPQDMTRHRSNSACSDKAAATETDLAPSVSTNDGKGSANNVESLIHTITETSKEIGQRNVLDTRNSSLLCSNRLQKSPASETDSIIGTDKGTVTSAESSVHLDSVSSTVNLETYPSSPAVVQVSNKEMERAEVLTEALNEVAKVSSTTRKDSLLQEKVVVSSNEAPQHLAKDCEPDSTDDTEHSSEPSSSTVLPQDEDSMMLTLKTIKPIPNVISPLTSPIRQVKKVQSSSHGKQTHIRSLGMDLQNVSLQVDANRKAVDVNKENKKPDFSMPAPGGPPAGHGDQEELEDGEIVSEDEADEAPVAAKPPNTLEDGKKSEEKTNPINNPNPQTILTKMPSKRNPKDLIVKTVDKSSRSVANSPPGKRRFKTVPPPDPKVLPPASSTVEEIMNMFKVIRLQLRKKYMKLHKSFPKKTFNSVIEMSNLSFTDLVSSLNLHRLCDQESVMKAKLKKLIINVMNKIGNNGIVNRIFEQNSDNLKSKLWAFMDGQLDFLFKDIQATLSGSSSLLESKPLISHTKTPDEITKVQDKQEESRETITKRRVPDVSNRKARDSKPLLQNIDPENPDKTAKVLKKRVSPYKTTAKRRVEVTSIVKAKDCKPVLHSGHVDYSDKTTKVQKKPELSLCETAAKKRVEEIPRAKDGPVASTPAPPRRHAYPTGLGNRGKNLKMSVEESDEDPDATFSHENVQQTSKTQLMVTDTSVERVGTLVRQISHSGSILDKAEFEILTEQQTSSLTFNLVSDSQMGDIFKSLLQGSDLLENSASLADNQSWLLATPKKELSSDRSLLTGMLTPTKYGTPSKLLAAWASVSPYKFLSPTRKVQMPPNPAALDESCLLEIPSSPEPSTAPETVSTSLLKTYSILAEDLAVSLTIPSPLKSDNHLNFLPPASDEPVPTPEEVLNAHFSEDALLDGEDAMEHDIHLSLDTDNSSCESSSAAGHTWDCTDPSKNIFHIRPHMPMQAVVTERSNDHFIVKIRHAHPVSTTVAPATDVGQAASPNLAEAPTNLSAIDVAIKPSEHYPKTMGRLPVGESGTESLQTDEGHMLSGRSGDNGTPGCKSQVDLPILSALPAEGPVDVIKCLSKDDVNATPQASIDVQRKKRKNKMNHLEAGSNMPVDLPVDIQQEKVDCDTPVSKSHVVLPISPTTAVKGQIDVTKCSSRNEVAAVPQENLCGQTKKRKRKMNHLEAGSNVHVDFPVMPSAMPVDPQQGRVDCDTPGSKSHVDLPIAPTTAAEVQQGQIDVTKCSSQDEVGVLPQDNINGKMRKRKKKHKESKSKRAKTEAVADKHLRKRAKVAKCNKKRAALSTPKKKISAPSPQLSPQSLSAKNVVRKHGVVVTWTREEDRDILIDLKVKGASRDTFSALSEKLNKSPSQIAERFSQLMKLFKKKEKMESP